MKSARNSAMLIGKVFGYLTVVSRQGTKTQSNGKKHAEWLCACSCGMQKSTTTKLLKNGKVKSCGCQSHPITILDDLSGRRFGRLVANEYRIIVKNGINHTIWSCLCDCGAVTEVRRGNLTQGVTKSCGCLRDEFGKTHGKSRTLAFQSWWAMVRRCTDPKHDTYKNYGAKGITVCSRWRNSFESFLEDMGPRPTGTSIDRYPDKTGNYEPGNCRWATLKEQANNQTKNRNLTFNGETKTLAEWARSIGISDTGLSHRLKKMPIQAALSLPINPSKRTKK